MKKTVKLDPFNYDVWNLTTTVVQLATAIIGLLLALNGNEAGLLGLGALAGGTRGNLILDFLRWYRTNGPKPPVMPSILPVLVLATGFFLVGCGTTVSKQFLVDSQAAVMAEASDYFDGCRMVTIAPAFTVDWNQNVTYGGGLFAGCEAKGRLAEFRCAGVPDEETGKVQIHCYPLTLWEQVEGTP